ncbi:hypothetical protein N0V84_011135 [Fusarium piperis]|uniref:Uncharacterized protein n=1 Tax=Fusarium piperis TaxID=1435070 RepID=A0A9W8W4F0_9HYPO|nr:hypothetical protein N0V84_011135 [Fusarium piperis]
MASAPPPTYEDAVIRRVNEHYLTCTESSNEEYLKRYTRQRVATFAVRGWVVSNRGTTVVVGPWWMDGGSHKTWEMFKPTPDESAKPTLNPAARERLVRWLRSLRRLPIEQETRSIFAVNGTPIQPDEIEYTLTAESGHDDWTKEWGWKVRLRAYTYAKHIGCSRWTITYRLYLDDLPSLLRAGGISWEDAVVNNGEDRFEEDPYPYPNRRWNWARSSLCLPASQSGQKWKAKVNERHREQSSLERDFRCRLSTETVYK